jgi:hypothetical protein
MRSVGGRVEQKQAYCFYLRGRLLEQEDLEPPVAQVLQSVWLMRDLVQERGQWQWQLL